MYLPQTAAQLIQNYYKDSINWTRSIADIQDEPYPEQIWMWWHALAYYRENRSSYTQLEDAPAGLEWVTVMGEERKQYTWRGGKYVLIQTVSKKDCYKFYG